MLSPLLFIAVLDLINRKTVVKDAMKKLLYADDLALVTNGKQELHETMEEWNGLFIKHGLKLNLEKIEVLHIGHQREELDIELEGKILNQRDSFVYLGGAVCGDGKTEREVRRRVQAAANAWRWVMADRRISKRLTGKFMSTCVTLACLYGTETLALTELQHRLLSLSLPLSLSLSLSTSLSLSLVRWRYLRCCDFDDVSPSFPIGRQL